MGSNIVFLDFEEISKFIQRLAGPAFVGAGTGLISLIAYTYFAVILPSTSDLRGGYLLYYNIDFILDLLLSIFIVFNIYFNYYKTISTDPGSPTFPTISVSDEIQEEIDLDLLNPSSSSSSSSSINDHSLNITTKWKYCKKCERPKPPRCHHCKICDKCVLKMDHHCPWMANCKYIFFIL
ncbi:hypothetical protein DLAC_04914 [Tieghemostelium lacteum]|uniref:Palmitoyltransferase n=1 Tax=Tieghemostelium lacteum TaxID=361077 RepID=A0A151ZJ61_TIELA|nr:hypothetical protein DLAC_04914 [Tieghemostelium lacteum]|eukprot:KYQ94013.1 hypothetical protein DLAC_04914 [Tieghemostelium lacteum]